MNVMNRCMWRQEKRQGNNTRMYIP